LFFLPKLLTFKVESESQFSSCQAVAKFCEDYKSHTVPASIDYTCNVALPWGHVNTPVHLLTGLVACCYQAICMRPTLRCTVHIAWLSCAVWLI